MNKFVLGIVMVSVLAVALLGTTGLVYAQTATPQAPGFGPGMMGGRGSRGGAGNGIQDGILHNEMVAAFSQKLGMTAAELDARLDKGETMAQVAYSKGLSADQFTTLMTEVRTQAVDQAVKDGKITQQQADWMKQRSNGVMMGGGRGTRGSGQGNYTNTNCPYYIQP